MQHEKIADCQTVALKLHIWRVLKILMNAQKDLSLMEANTISGIIMEISISAEAPTHLLHPLPNFIKLASRIMEKYLKNGWALSALPCSQSEQEY